MSQSSLLDILESLSFGQEAAENEDNLADIFVSNSSTYRGLTGDEFDIITGGKGTGKSALFRMITENRIHEDLCVIAASNPTGSPVFQVLFTESATEQRLRGIWTAYIAGLIGNWIVDEFSGDANVSADVGEIEEVLHLLGLRKRPQEKRGLLARIRAAKSVEASAGASLAGSLSAGLKFDLPGEEAGADVTTLQPGDFHAILMKAAEILDATGIRLWLAFDRLDECFVRDSEIERRALRALLRTHLDIADALGFRRTIRLKVFLRSDLMRRMTRDAVFTNSTHLRLVDLRWNASAIAHMIAKRAWRSEEFRRAYEPQLEGERTGAIWKILLAESGPKENNSQYNVCSRMSDGSREFNPRNVVSLMNFATALARSSNRRAVELGHPPRFDPPLISDSELKSAEADVSRKRLRDSVLNEFPVAMTYVPRMEGGPAEYGSLRELMTTIGIPDMALGEAEEIASELCLSGVLRATGKGYSVPRLYRPALRPQVRPRKHGK